MYYIEEVQVGVDTNRDGNLQSTSTNAVELTNLVQWPSLLPLNRPILDLYRKLLTC